MGVIIDREGSYPQITQISQMARPPRGAARSAVGTREERGP